MPPSFFAKKTSTFMEPKGYYLYLRRNTMNNYEKDTKKIDTSVRDYNNKPVVEGRDVYKKEGKIK